MATSWGATITCKYAVTGNTWSLVWRTRYEAAVFERNVSGVRKMTSRRTLANTCRT
jgi:hypothetical protein